MFDWFYDFLYLITKSIFKIIDSLISCSMYLCGMKDITVDGREIDLLTWLIKNDDVKTGFIVCTIVSFILVIFFTIYAVLKAVVSEKADATPGQICVRAFKSVLKFLFMPVIMITLILSLNTIGRVVFQGTAGGTSDGLGKYLAISFAREGMNDVRPISELLADPGFDYTSTLAMKQYIDLSEYDYFYAWVAGFAILYQLAKAILIFVDRVFSISILFILSPFPIAASVIDDGQYFKSWRDQLLSKFMVGYGTLIGINLYGVIVSNIACADMSFFPDNSFLDLLLRLSLILGGAVSLNRIIAFVIDILGKGGGQAALQAADQDVAALGEVGSAAMSIGGGALSLIGKALGLGGDDKKGGGGGGGGGKGENSEKTPSGNKDPSTDTNKKPDSEKDPVTDAIQGEGDKDNKEDPNKKKEENNNNNNNEDPNKKKEDKSNDNNMVTDIIKGGDNNGGQ